MSDKKTKTGAVPKGPKRRIRTGSTMAAMAAMGAAAMMASTAVDDFNESTQTANRPEEPNDLPDRMSGDPDSPYYDKRCTDVAVIFNDRLRPNDVNEYCVSEGWITVVRRNRRGELIRENSRRKKPIVSRRMMGSVFVCRKSEVSGA